MQLVFLDRSSLAYKDYAFIGKDFEIVMDLVVSQKSNFTINKESINAKIGDIAVLKERDFSYIGIIQSITQNTDKTSKVQLLDFKELFNIKVPIESFSGDICVLLKDLIKRAFISNSDTKQNLRYLSIDAKASIQGQLVYEDDSLVNIKELIEILSKTYGLIVKFKVLFLRGRFQRINVIIDEVSKTTKLRYDLKAIHDLKITDSDQYTINKVIFYPKKENMSYTWPMEYYLLKDGSVTHDKNDPNRFDYVNVDSQFYSDKDYETLQTKAIGMMVHSSTDHQITFNLSLDNNVFIPLSNMFLGFLVEFHSKDKIYYTLFTQIKYKNNFNECYLTLGEHRSSLTDKIKLLTKGGSGGTNVSINSAVANMDGGVY